MDCIRLKSICTPRETLSRIKRKSAEYEKIFNIYLSDKGFNIQDT
jgi:hypothetical protein